MIIIDDDVANRSVLSQDLNANTDTNSSAMGTSTEEKNEVLKKLEEVSVTMFKNHHLKSLFTDISRLSSPLRKRCYNYKRLSNRLDLNFVGVSKYSVDSFMWQTKMQPITSSLDSLMKLETKYKHST